MAIDGLIGFVSDGFDATTGEPTADLFLVDRPEGRIRGQETPRILSPSWKPEPGMVVWGGSGSVLISWPGIGGEFVYDRIGYTRPRERRP